MDNPGLITRLKIKIAVEMMESKTDNGETNVVTTGLLCNRLIHHT
jgi:hypothetical protein